MVARQSKGLNVARSSLTLIICATACTLWSTPALTQPIQTYTARTERSVARTGAVIAGGITWRCAATTCTTSGPWPAPGVSACTALVREVGRIIAYGRPGLALSAEDLARCNAPPLSVRDFTHAPPPAPGTINTTELFLVGGDLGRPRPDIASLTISTPELFLIGGAVTAPTPDIAPGEFTTPELFLVGAGPRLPDLTHRPTPH